MTLANPFVQMGITLAASPSPLVMGNQIELILSRDIQNPLGANLQQIIKDRENEGSIHDYLDVLATRGGGVLYPKQGGIPELGRS